MSQVFTKLQYGLQSVFDTPVAADTILVGTKVQPITDHTSPRRPEENLGVRSASMRSWIGQYLWARTLPFEDAYFQLLPYMLSLGLVGGVTASEQNAGEGDYLWDFTPSESAANNPDLATIEMGDDQQAWEVANLQAEAFRFSGEINQGPEASPLSFEADVFGDKLTKASFTGGLSLPSTEPINAKLVRMYLDTSWAGVGGTEKTGTLRAFNVEILTGVHPVFDGSTSQTYDRSEEGLISVRAELTLEGNATAVAIWDAKENQSLQVLRLEVEGSQIGAGDNHKLTLDVGGTFEDVVPLSSEDRGDNMFTAVLVGQYDTTGAKKLGVQVETDVSAI